jgi:hypothetical protein
VSAWLYAVITIGSVIVGVVLNYFLVTALAKHEFETSTAKYQERVDRLTAEVNRYEDRVEDQNKEIARLGRIVAAFTGQANGVDFSD